MKYKVLIFVLLLCSMVISCRKEFECTDPNIELVFINYSQPDIDTFVVKKFNPRNNFLVIIDSFTIGKNLNANYLIHNDTTNIRFNGSLLINAAFDWQIFIPAKNKTIFLSEILIEKRTETSGSINFDVNSPRCRNNVKSAKVDGQIVGFSETDYLGSSYVYFRN